MLYRISTKRVAFNALFYTHGSITRQVLFYPPTLLLLQLTAVSAVIRTPPQLVLGLYILAPIYLGVHGLPLLDRISPESTPASQVLQRVSIACYAERCTSYGKSVRPSVCLTVCLSVRHTLALCQNHSSYDHGVSTEG